MQYVEGETTAVEWAQFERLVARVRCLVFDVRPEIAPSTVNLLKVRWEARAEPLFPNLSILEWPDSSNDTQQQLLQVLCATQTLSSFVIKHGFRYDTILPSTDLSSIAGSSPSLAHLHTKAYWQVSWYAPLTTFHNLRSIRMQSVSPAFYRHLGSLPFLGYVRTYVLPVEGQREMSPPPSYRGFPCLRSIEIPDRTSVPPSTLVDMLLPITSPSLISLVLGVQATRPSDVLSFLEFACSLDTLRSLRRFHFMVERTGDRLPEPAAYTFSDMFNSLSKLRSLEVVTIQACTAAIELTDADVAQLPAAWPQLTSFSVTRSSLGADAMSSSRGGAPVARPSLIALVGLAQALSSLEELDVEIADVPDTELAHLEGCAGSRQPQMALTGIAFAHHGYRKDLKLPDVERLGHVLHKMFPNLRGLGERSVVDGMTRYVGWAEDELQKDVFRLLAKLEELRVAGKVGY